MSIKRPYEYPVITLVELCTEDILTSSNDVKADLGVNDGEWMKGVGR